MPSEVWKIVCICNAVGRGGVGGSSQELLHGPFPRGSFSDICSWQSQIKQRPIFFHTSAMTCFQRGAVALHEAVCVRENRYPDDQSSANTLLWLKALVGAVMRHPVPILSFQERWQKERPQEEREEMTKDWGGVCTGFLGRGPWVKVKVKSGRYNLEHILLGYTLFFPKFSKVLFGKFLLYLNGH